MFETKIEVRYSETDKMGIVYHSRYFPWFEIARAERLKSYGIEYSELEKRGLMMPITECNCKYRKGAVYGDVVTVKVRFESLTVARAKDSYEVYSNGCLLAEGYTVQAFVDDAFKPLNLKKSFPDIYSIFEAMRGDDK